MAGSVENEKEVTDIKNIRTKSEKKPKERSSSSRMAKEVSRTVALEAKEKAVRLTRAAEGIEDSMDKSTEESPHEYAVTKVSSAGTWTGSHAMGAAYDRGKKLAIKTREKAQEKRRQGSVAEKDFLEKVSGGKTEERGNGKKTVTRKTEQKSAVHKAGQTTEGKIRTREARRIGMKESAKHTVKSNPRSIKISPYSKVGAQAQQAMEQKHQAEKAAKTAKQTAIQSAKAAKNTQKAAKTTVRGTVTAAKAGMAALKSFVAGLGTVGIIIVLVLIIVVGIIGGALSASDSSSSSQPLSKEVLSYTSVIRKYAGQYGIPEYVPVIQAIMMQESGGRGTDPMQASECPCNTRFPKRPGGITDPDYSIQAGIQYYAGCINGAGCMGPKDMERLRLSLQGYNYGNGYILWAIKNYGGYSEANARKFSEEQAKAHGWSSYGDPEYVPHVLRYYSAGNPFDGLFGNSQIISVAKAEIGNEGGKKFWSWYGFDSHVSWCACFVSWCGDRCGFIQSGVMPKFSLCTDGVRWFKDNGKWQGRGIIPTPGMIIFFDWQENGKRDGESDHVGIVEKCEKGIVYTIEGNSGDAVRRNNYPIDSASILGYGILN